jgi:hypothetical protein
VAQWKEIDIGTGRLLNRVIRAIEINVPDLRNNLVGWEPRYGPGRVPHRLFREAQSDKGRRSKVERAIYDLFQTDRAEGDIFQNLQDLGGAHYEVLAYLFFLKDWDRFMPIRTKTFDTAFRDLGLDLRMTRQCSWENYCRYNEGLREVLAALRDVAGLEGARLIDAHSFCWMLVRLKPPAADLNLSIPLPRLALSVQAAPQPEGGLTILDMDDLGEVGDEEFDRRNKENRRRGRLAEDLALRSERKRLEDANRADLAAKVQIVSNKPGLGFDILSWETNGERRHIEVKAARSSGKNLAFFLSQNEWNKSRALANYYFYLVLNIDGLESDVRVIAADQVTPESRKATNYIVGLSFEGTAT